MIVLPVQYGYSTSSLISGPKKDTTNYNMFRALRANDVPPETGDCKTEQSTGETAGGRVVERWTLDLHTPNTEHPANNKDRSHVSSGLIP
jgi:hypothetical protein